MTTPEHLWLLGDSIILFKHSAANIGITTNNFGDCAYYHDGDHKWLADEKQNNRLNGLLKTKYWHKPIVAHRDKIAIIDNRLNDPGQYYHNVDGLIVFNRKPKPANVTRPSRGTNVLLSPTADCPTVALTDADCDFQAIIHSGREGTYLNIVSRAVKMIRDQGYVVNNILAFIWPGVHGDYYRVGADILKRFTEKFAADNFIQDDHLYLEPLIIRQLLESGVVDQNIISANLYTHSQLNGNTGFYSHRLHNATERNCVFIAPTIKMPKLDN